MGLLDRITAPAAMAHEVTEANAQHTVHEAELAGAEATIAHLHESLAELELALEDQGWERLSWWADQQFSRDGLRRAARLCRTMAVANPLIRRGLNLRAGYVWGGGVTIAARAVGDEGQQDVNAVVQAFLDDRGNRKTLTAGQARETNERALGTDGSLLFACFTNPRTGRVQVRRLPYDEVAEVITNPEDRTEVWFYRRIWTDGQGRQTTTYYPDIDYQPRSRVLRVNGQPVRWDAPVIHVAVNALPDWDFGIGDAYSAIAWARAYKEFLEDWAKLVKALSRFAWRATSDKKSKAQTAAVKARQAPSTNDRTGEPNDIGALVSMGPGQQLEAIPKSGATIDSESGRPLAAMVAAGLDVPVTMLLADPGTTGARATAETLDRPTEDMAGMRRQVWTDVHRRLLDYVIDQAVKAPAGPLKGTAAWDRDTGREVVTLAGDTDGSMRTIDIVWPPLDETPVDTLVKAIEAADGTGKLPPLTIARLLLEALGVDDVDEVLEQLTDDDGNFVDPDTTAGDQAVRAFRRGEDPAEAVR